MPLPPSGHASLLGTTFAGYEVIGLIGRGAVGTVYLAHDLRLKRQVALKVLLGTLARDPAVVQSFHQEAQAAAPLRHPNIVRIYAAGIDCGTPYIAMEYVEGEPLDRFLRRKGQLKWPSALHIAQQVAEALDCAHARGITHRDVKPANIMLDRQGRVCLADFGIANIQSEDGPGSPLGGFVGTPHYMSPEQCAGLVITAASDLYSLGVTLYQLLAGCLPFDADSPVALIKRITSDEPPRLNRIVPGLPDDVSRLVAYLIQKRPQDRPADARTVCGLIARIQAENGGGSALPAALNAFIREQAEPPSLNVVAPTPWRARIQQQQAAGLQRSHVVRRRMALAGFAAVAAIGLGILAALWPARPDAIRQAPPVLSSTPLDHTRSGAALVSLNTPRFSIEELAWVGDNPVVAVQMRGRAGTWAQGACGLLTVDVEAGTLSSLCAPVAARPVSATWLRAIPSVPADSALHDSVLTFACNRIGLHSEVLTQAQRYTEARPRAQILYQGPLPLAATAPQEPWDRANPVYAVAKPDGYTISLLLRSPLNRSSYLVERDTRWKPLDRVSPPLTDEGAEIIAQSVCYSPDGGRIAYARNLGIDNSELWVVGSGATEKNGRRLAVGAINPITAFSPSGNRLAISVNRSPGDDPQVQIINSMDGALEAELGPGQLCREAWYASGEYLVIAARAGEAGGAGDTRQLCAVETHPPYRRRALTAIPSGVIPVYAVSRNTRWAVGATDADGTSSLILVDLTRVPFSSLAERNGSEHLERSS